jgi:hypothetical protein
MQQGFSVQHTGPAGDFSWLVIALIVGGFISLIWAVICLILWWKVFSKAGYAGAIALLTLVPLFGDLILLCILAFGKWPVLREIERLKLTPSQPPQA